MRRKKTETPDNVTYVRAIYTPESPARIVADMLKMAEERNFSNYGFFVSYRVGDPEESDEERPLQTEILWRDEEPCVMVDRLREVMMTKLATVEGYVFSQEREEGPFWCVEVYPQFPKSSRNMELFQMFQQWLSTQGATVDVVGNA